MVIVIGTNQEAQDSNTGSGLDISNELCSTLKGNPNLLSPLA